MSIGSVSALGSEPAEIWGKYLDQAHFLQKKHSGPDTFWAGFLTRASWEEISRLRSEYKEVDDAVLLAILASRKATKRAGWKQGSVVGVNIGSSRGATGLFEAHHQRFLESGKAEILSSPNTTLGNISSWVAQDLKSSGPDISHSVTCSTSLHAVLNAIAWITAGMAERFLAGGSEAALTPFTLAQMRAMKIMAAGEEPNYPCLALDPHKRRNSMVLGEGAAVLCLEAGIKPGAMAVIAGIGYATEELEHPVSISASGTALRKSMEMALSDLAADQVDAVVMHAPGTVKGDQSEMQALKVLFGEHLPALTTNKWKIGHTFGASGTLSIELAVLMLQHQQWVGVPYLSGQKPPEKLEHILVNAVGFGGNAVSILLKAVPRNQI